MNFADLLKVMVHNDGSDMFITAGAPPSIKIHGKIQPVGNEELTAEQSRELAYSVMTEDKRAEFETTNECNFAIHPKSIGRFRVNVFMQQNRVGMVLRKIETKIPALDDLRVPAVLKDISMTKRGLVLVVGGTGTGKSTTLAAMIDYRNQNSNGHIVTIEDPIEFVHEHKGCIVSQREVGVDTDSFEIALKNTLRQAPDVILIGEIRDQETMEHAIAFAETGHLCMATLHANNANQAMDRIVNFFPEERQRQLFMDLSLNLKAVVSQRLIACVDGRSRRAAVEIMLNSPLISELILKGEIHGIKDIMLKSEELGMQTFDQALYKLYQSGEISYKDALTYADSPNELRLMVKLSNETTADELTGELTGLKTVDYEDMMEN